ncbi:TetR family transcriptional regulator [Phycicoccus sp. CSK15P-2]|uniref:TetR/AcrR family transcriptional regulator n=1 Tax=Phycicoccus sp. CSK15P-2 TaxID=2807627 RepID=UPI00194FDFA0|nr:TetR/AcrR family transcriptional regulator [Phycicoccus sp. CSK15P-2]MBM6405282.1 TetR family transcriptional regulator [Phycicoccus sp. CSK15P-2]
MGRWQPGSTERLEHAALDLFAEQGFADTTVPQITARAGLTTRTFFRHFADKREVLFSGDDLLPERVAALLADVPPTVGPMELVADRLAPAVSGVFEGRSLGYLLRRRAVVAAEPALQERELRKFSAMVDALEQGFVDRGVDRWTAQLVAELAVAAFRVAAGRWLDQRGTPDLATVMDETLAAMRHVVSTPSM